jgi:hypothetical protein
MVDIPDYTIGFRGWGFDLAKALTVSLIMDSVSEEY